MDKKRVVVGMSGGIDSSVTALLLHKQGYEVIGVQMEYWSEDFQTTMACGNMTSDHIENVMVNPENKATNKMHKVVQNKCCSNESMTVSRQVCEHLDAKFFHHPVKDLFKKSLVDFYLEGKRRGEIPNPCTRCNRVIKFGALLDFARSLGIRHVATGHYAQIVYSDLTGRYAIKEAIDNNKDQSYFLYELEQDQLASMILPLGGLTKDQVREIAAKEGLTAYKKSYQESQGLCFYQEKTPELFLQRNTDQTYHNPGNFIDHNGHILGQHKGAIFYTPGQRKGLDLGGLSEPYFVISTDITANTVIVGPKELLMKREVTLSQLHEQQEVKEGRYLARIRYRMKKVACTLLKEESSYKLVFDEPVYAPTAGQVAVLYNMSDTIVAGGIITG